MLKNIQIKIVLAFMIIGLCGISILGISYVYSLENMNSQITQDLGLIIEEPVQ